MGSGWLVKVKTQKCVALIPCLLVNTLSLHSAQGFIQRGGTGILPPPPEMLKLSMVIIEVSSVLAI